MARERGFSVVRKKKHREKKRSREVSSSPQQIADMFQFMSGESNEKKN